MNLEFNVVWFALSFITYTLLRQPDEHTTSKLAERLDIERHEVNPTITWLAKRLGLKRTLLATWLVIGLALATADTYLEQTIPLTLPLFALIVGFAHVLAAANNTRVGYLLDSLGIEEFERQHDESMRELLRLSWKARIMLLFRSNTEAFLMSILALPLAIALGYSLVASNFFIVLYTPDKFLVLPITAALAFILALLLVYPAKIVGPIILAIRLAKNHPNEEESDAAAMRVASIELPVPLVEHALSEAIARGVDVVRITAPLTQNTE